MIFKLLHKIKPFLFFLILASSLIVIYVKTSKATTPDETITCNVGGCSGISGSLFNEVNMFPTQSIIKTLEAVNNYTEERTFAVEVKTANFFDSNPSLADVLKITITEIDSGRVVYGPNSINQWLGSGYTLLTSIPSGGNKTYEFKVDLDNVDNIYQEKTLLFDLNLGFEAVESTNSTPTPNPSETSDGGGTNALTTINTAVAGLTTFVNKLPSVFGLQTEEINLDQEGKDIGEVKGVSCLDKNYVWWLPLVIQLIVGIAMFKYFGKEQYKIMKRLIIIILGLAIISQAVHGLLGCNCATGIWCPRYIYLNLAITVLFFIYWIVSYIKKLNSIEDVPINN